MPAVLSDPVVDVVAAVDKLRADDRVITSPDMLLCDIEAMLAAITGLQAVMVDRLREATAVGATAALCGRSTKNWLVEEQLLAAADAGRLVRLMRQLPARPLTAEAFRASRLNAAHAAAILTALNTLPPSLQDTVEPHLIERALEYPPEEIAGYVDELLDRLGLDRAGDIRRERRHTERGVDISTTLAGGRSLTGTLTPDVGSRFEAALNDAAHKSGPDDTRTLRQRRHDGLAALADAWFARTEPSFTGAPRTVIVTMDLDVLDRRLRDTLVTLPGGASISAATARRLACDAELIPVVLGTRSEVLDIGVAGHEFTTAVRRAAYLRDDGACVFPRCTNDPVELHHITFRRHNGTNALDNAAWLCLQHHWLVHEGDWTLARAPDGGYTWTRPDGHTRHQPPG